MPTGWPAKPPDVAPPRIGVAGWSIHRAAADLFPASGSHLERYAAVFNAVEINSSFHREHRPATYERWARAVPAGFRFSAKVPREITHVRRLVDCEPLLERFLPGPAALGDRAGPLIVQLPPSLAFDASIAGPFLDDLRRRWPGAIVAEPRHPTWFTGPGDALLASVGAGRVAADPAVVPGAGVPGGAPEIAYWRLHGSPRTYYSAYAPEFIAGIAAALATAAARERWCILDNTALGAAAHDALAVDARARAALL